MAKRQSKKVAKEIGVLASDESATSQSPITFLRDKYGQDLYDRAKKNIGMSDEMIASFPDAESLKRYCDGIHSKSNPDARMKEGEPVDRKNFEDNMPDVFTMESILPAEWAHKNRDQFDRDNREAFLRDIRRKYGAHEPVRIVADTSFVAKKHELVTTFTIYYK